MNLLIILALSAFFTFVSEVYFIFDESFLVFLLIKFDLFLYFFE